MNFIFNADWQLLFLVACFFWVLLLLREIYRFRTLRSRFCAFTLVLAFLAIISWISVFFLMLVRTGVLSATVTYASFLVLTPMILGFAKKHHASFLHPESLAQCDWNHATQNAIIEKIVSRGDIRQALSEHGQTTAFLRALMERLIAMGHHGLLPRLGSIPNLHAVLNGGPLRKSRKKVSRSR